MPTTADQLREIAAAAAALAAERERAEFFPKYVNRAISGVKSSANDGESKFAYQVPQMHGFMVPDILSEIQKEFPGVVTTARDSGFATVWITVSWELTP